jgi:Recombinase/Resolvase, N terminal domain
MQAAKRREFDLVAAWRFDRFSRDQDQTIIAVFMLKQHNVKVVSVMQPLPDGPIGIMLLSTYQFGARLELDGIRERIDIGKVKRVRSGKLYATAFPKYGYMFADAKKERYIANPDTAPVVQRIFTEYATGGSIRSLRYKLTNDGIPTPAFYLSTHSYYAERWKAGKRSVGKSWRISTLKKILSDSAYMGKLVGLRTKLAPLPIVDPLTGETRFSKRRITRDLDDARRFEYGPDVCSPLISEELFNTVQDRLKENQERASRNIKHPEEVLLRGGLVKCGYCGNSVSPFWNGYSKRPESPCS